MLFGGLVSILLLLPNLLWMLFPPHDQSKGEGGPVGGLYRLMEILEWVGRIAALMIPFFYQVEAGNTRQLVALAVMALALLFYYAGWVRYFVRDRNYALLFEPFLGMPLPLAISPIVYYLAASALFGSWYLALATTVLAVGHLWISFHESREVQDRP